MEITEHTRFGGGLHGLRMLGILPVPIFGRMAFRAALRADVTTIGGRDGRMVIRQRHGQGSIGSLADHAQRMDTAKPLSKTSDISSRAIPLESHRAK